MNRIPERGFTNTFAAVFIALVVAFLFALWLGDAHAQEAPQIQCGPTAAVEAGITKKYGETLAAIGMWNSPRGVLSIFANAKTGTYTFLLRRPGGISCMIGDGTGFTMVPIDPPPPDGTDL